MSHTLNLVDGMLTTARALQSAGRTQAAIDLLQRLAGFQLAPAIAEETHGRLADLYADLEQFKPARRHLAIALTYRPQHAAYHHRMGCWIEADPAAASDRARMYYRRAVRSEPDNPEYWADYGVYLLSAGWLLPGRGALRRAFRLGSHDAELVGRIAAALREAGLWDDARRLVRRARFQHARDRRFDALWQQHQFAQVCAQQQARDEAYVRRSQAPMVLPFGRADGPAGNVHVDGKIIRLDRADSASVTHPKRRPKNRRSN